MLAETENLHLRRSSTAAIIIDDVRWPYFFCHVYVSRETSFLSRRLIGHFGPDGLRSEETYHIVCMCVCVCVCARARARASMHACTYVCMYVCMCSRTCVCVCVEGCVRFTFYKSISWAQCKDICVHFSVLWCLIQKHLYTFNVSSSGKKVRSCPNSLCYISMISN